MAGYTKPGAEVFAPTDNAGNLRAVDNGDAQVWATEVERGIAAAAVITFVNGGWQSGTAYTVNQALTHNDVVYRCIANHTSAAGTEPGVGASWETVWEVMIGAIALEDGSVELAKIANIAGNKLIGRGAGTSGAPEEIGVGGGLEFDGSNNLRQADGGTANAKLADMEQGTVKMRRAGAGTGAPTDTTLANLKSDLSLDQVDNTADSNKMMQRGSLPESADLNTFLAPGTYLGVAGGGYSMLPTGFSGTFFLTNETPGPSAGVGQSRYIKQTITDFSNTGAYRQVWERTVDRNNLPATDVWHTRHRVYAANLTENFEYRGAIADSSYNNVVSDGTYVATGGMTDGPSGAPAGALVKVRRLGNFGVQEITSITDATSGWRRVIQGIGSAPVYREWLPFGGSGGGGGDFSDSNIVCFGDSITENGNYPLLLATRLGANVTNGGFGGCRMAVHDHATVGVYYDPFSMYRLAEYMENDTWSTLTAAADALFAYNADDNRPNAAALAGTDWSEVDYAIIFYGTNDFTADVPIGTGSDSDGTTFKGAINVTIESILTAYPHIKLMFVTPMWRTVAETPNNNGDVLSDFADAIIERAGAYQIPVFDMYRECGINALNAATYIPDGTHPVVGFGYQHVAGKIGGALTSRF